MSYKNIQELPYRIYNKLPERMKKFIRPGLRAFYSLKDFFLLIFHLRFAVFLVQGREKWGHENLTTLFFGDTKGLLFISDLLYSEEPINKSLGKIFIWRIKSGIKSNLPKTDLIFIHMDGFMSKFLPWQEFIIIPAWVLLKLDLSKPLPEVWKLPKNKCLRENLRIFRRHNYSYEITHDPVKFEYFYHHMYLPYVMGRYGELVFVTGFREMERVFKKGELLLVKKGNDYISGIILVRISRDTIFAHSLGITEGKGEYLKEGALTAVYYFGILWAKERGYKWFDFGDCRSFLKDGVLNNKKSWGMEIKISRRFRNIFGMKICNFHQGVKAFLEQNPFIFIDQGKLKGLVFVEKNHEISFEEVQACVKTYSVPGLDCLVIVSDQGFDQEAKEFASTCSSQKIQPISIKEEIFFKRFTNVLQSGKHSGSQAGVQEESP